MFDVYLLADNIGEAVAALSPFGLASADDGLVAASHRHALAVVNPLSVSPVAVAIRCRDEALADSVRASSLAVIGQPEGWTWQE
jgi:hypothetical protein